MISPVAIGLASSGFKALRKRRGLRSATMYRFLDSLAHNFDEIEQKRNISNRNGFASCQLEASLRPMERKSTYTLTEKDAVAAARIAVRLNLSRPSMLAVLVGLYVAILVLLLLLLGFARWMELLIAALVAPPVAVWLIYRFLLPFQARSHFRQSKALLCETVVTWDAQSVSLESDFGRSQLAWSDYRRIVERGRFFMLFQSDMLYNIVPKDVFDEAQLEDFRKCAGLKVTAAAEA